MDIGIVKTPLDLGSSAYSAQTPTTTQAVVSIPTTNIGDAEANTVISSADDKSDKKPVKLQDVTNMTQAMNKFVEAMNSNIRFMVYEKTNQLVVQVVDQTNNKVLKEFPPREFLDTIAAIRDYVGILLDKKI